ncbi:hypothetical protein Tco_1216186 [Tanacetum coccineum]
MESQCRNLTQTVSALILPILHKGMALMISGDGGMEKTSSTNEAVNTAHEVSTASSQGQASSLTYADDVMFSFFANQSNSPYLDQCSIWSRFDMMILKRWNLKMVGGHAYLEGEIKSLKRMTGRNLDFIGKKLLALIRQRLDVTTATCERKLLLENRNGTKESVGI